MLRWLLQILYFMPDLPALLISHEKMFYELNQFYVTTTDPANEKQLEQLYYETLKS